MLSSGHLLSYRLTFADFLVLRSSGYRVRCLLIGLGSRPAIAFLALCPSFHGCLSKVVGGSSRFFSSGGEFLPISKLRFSVFMTGSHIELLRPPGPYLRQLSPRRIRGIHAGLFTRSTASAVVWLFGR